MIRRRAAAVLVLVLGLAAAFVGTLPSAHATPTVTTNRYGGADRFATATVIAEHAFPNGAPGAFLARATNFPGGSKGFADALAGNYVAGAVNGPILLTDPNSVPAVTLQALRDLKVKNVGILGGTSAVSSAVAQQLAATPSTAAAGGNLVVTRVGGATRYQTAAEIVQLLPTSYMKPVSGLPTALVARGDDFPDALAGGPLADAAHLPLLLTETDHLDPYAAAALQALKVKAVLILGGTSAVSAATESQIQALGITTVRLAGANRQQTATAIASYAILYLGFKDTLADLARGDDYPDALAGGPEAAATGPYPIVLTVSPTALGPDTAAWLRKLDGTLGEVDALGLQAAVSDAVLAEAAGDARCSLPQPSTTTTAGLLTPLTTVLGLLPTTTAAPVATTTTLQVCAGAVNTGGSPTTLGGSSTTGGGATLPTLPITVPTLPITLPTLPVTLPTLPVTLPTLPLGL